MRTVIKTTIFILIFFTSQKISADSHYLHNTNFKSKTPIFRTLGIRNSPGTAASIHSSIPPTLQHSNIPSPMAPLYGAEVKLTASDAEMDDRFGGSVAVAGDVAVVGAKSENSGGSYAGAAYIFERNSGGVNAWSEVKKLIGSDPQASGKFGCSVAASGDVVVIGASQLNTGGPLAGAAYVFVRTAGYTNAWGEVKKLIASDSEANDHFGCSVAIAGDVAVVGAYSEDVGGVSAGAAYVFERNMGGTNNWGEVKKLMASDAEGDDYFGHSVAVAGDVAVIGAFSKNNSAGAVYIFERNAGGTNNWGEVKKLTASNSQSDYYFGRSVAIAGDVVIAGSYGESSGGFLAGAAYIFERNAYGINNWGEVKKLIVSDADEYDKFGCSVAVDGDVVVVGALLEDAGFFDAGAAYVFKRNAGGINAWGEIKKITASDPDGSNYFGQSVAVAGDVAVIGSSGDDSCGANAGAAYITPVFCQTKNFIETAKKTASDAEAYDYLGYSVAVAGDVAVVGAYQENAGGSKAGAAYIFERNAGGINVWGEVKKLIASDAESDDWFGKSVAVWGDVVVVGAEGEDSGGSNSGAAYIFERNAGGINAWGEVKKLTASNTQATNNFGVSAAVWGDVVVIGANWEGSGGFKAGAAYIFERNEEGINAWGEVKKLTSSDAEEYDYFGRSVAVAGDVIVVGADFENSAGNDSGSAYIFERNKNGINAWGETKKLISSDAQPNDYFGYSVAVAGDVVIAGAICEDSGGTNAGAAYIFERNTNGIHAWGEVKKLTFSDAQPNDYFGWSVAVAGDVAVVGAGSVNVGAVYVFERNADGINAWGEIKKLTSENTQSDDFFGKSVAMGGDVIIIGALGDNDSNMDAGAVYVFEEFISLAPQISTNVLIFPSSSSELFEGDLTNIIWKFEEITDDLDGTNLTISKISVHIAETTNEVATVTNNIDNLLGEIPWLVPDNLTGGYTDYVLKFEVVDSTSLTNSRIFWDNEFTIVPEGAFGAVISYLLLVLGIWRKLIPIALSVSGSWSTPYRHSPGADPTSRAGAVCFRVIRAR